jgi:ribonuclease J
VVVVTIDRKLKKIVSAPQITSRGFVYIKASRDLIKESAEITARSLKSICIPMILNGVN